jgi:hypothetical protein
LLSKCNLHRYSEAEAIAALGGKAGGAMKAERAAAAAKKPSGGGGVKPGSIGSGVGDSKGLEMALQAGRGGGREEGKILGGGGGGRMTLLVFI